MSIEEAIYRAQAIREGGAVQRVHTIPHHGDASCATHSWNMAMLAWQLMPEPPRAKFIMAVLAHDVAERWAGDTPGPAKYSMNPQLGVELKKVETMAEKALALEFELTDSERSWLKGLDWLEYLMYAHDQLALGNRNFEPSIENARAHISESEWVPPQIRLFVEYYDWERTRNFVKGEIFGRIDNPD